MAIHRPPQHAGRWSRWLLIGIPPILAIVLIAVIIVLFLDNRADTRALDADLCPLDDTRISHRAVFLLDLRKPLGENQRDLLADSLRSVTMGLDADAELRIFALADSDAAPRREVARLCKPYDNAQLAFEGAKDSSLATRDCDDLPAQVPTHVRDRAQRFCARRGALQTEIERLASVPPGSVVENAYLIEALEETSLELATVSPPRSLYVLSDMMQHAAWYSQLEIGWSGWTFEEFARLRMEQDALVGPRPATVPGVGVTILYLPRQGVTDQLRTRMAHQRFWQRYFAEAFETTAAFVEEPPRNGYEIEPLMQRTTEADLIAAERARLQEEREEAAQEREEAARLLEQVSEERAALEEAQRAAAERAEAERAAAESTEAESAEAESAEVGGAAADGAGADEESTQTPAAVSDAEDDPPATTAPAIAQEPAPALDEQAAAQEPASEAAEQGDADAPPAVALNPAEASAEDALASEPPGQPPPASLAPAQLAGTGTAASDPLPSPAAATQPQEGGTPTCSLQLKPQYRGSAEYPPNVRWVYASATIAVRYVVDERGATIDDEVIALPDISTANPAEYLDRFAEHARSIVAAWEFNFEDGGGDCQRRQERTSAIEFSRRTRPPTAPVR